MFWVIFTAFGALLVGRALRDARSFKTWRSYYGKDLNKGIRDSLLIVVGACLLAFGGYRVIKREFIPVTDGERQLCQRLYPAAMSKRGPNTRHATCETHDGIEYVIYRARPDYVPGGWREAGMGSGFRSRGRPTSPYRIISEVSVLLGVWALAFGGISLNQRKKKYSMR